MVDITDVVVCAYYTAIDHLRDVEEELGVFARWERLGLNLGLCADRLEVIKEDNGLAEERVRAVLRNWLQKNYNVQKNGLPSWTTLANAVQPINCALAEKIRDRYS